jgi:hypothetical protein
MAFVLVQYGNVYEGDMKTEVFDRERGEEFASEYAEWDNGDQAKVLVYSCEEPPGEIPF